MSNLFVRPIETYKRDLDIVSAYHKQMALGLSQKYGKPFDECLEFVKRSVGTGGIFERTTPRLSYVGKNTVGDREMKVTTFLKFIDTIVKHELIVSPSMMVYQNPNQRRSISAKYIRVNIAKRNKSKAEMFAASQNGDHQLKSFKNNEQKTSKIKNNGLSGGHCNASTPLYKPSIHTTLTSTCRTATGYANANNEKILAGNRHYWSPDIVESNILSICSIADLVELERVMTKYGLVYPTVEDALSVVTRSSDLYWRDEKRIKDIEKLLTGLTPIQRAAFVYVGDLYHVAKLNDSFMRDMLRSLANPDKSGVDDVDVHMSKLNDDLRSLVGLLCPTEMCGKAVSRYRDIPEQNQRIVGSVSKSTLEVLNKYLDFYKVILISDVVPASVANIPTIIRRVALTSDTDSTIYTVQEWMQWYSGKISFEEETVNVGHVISFLSSTTITHLLAKMSANIGVVKEQLHQYAMKSEYYFPVFVLTSRAKTYFAYIGAQEGETFSEYDIETKGVVLKGSNSPKFIRDATKRMIKDILDTVRNDKELDINRYLKEVADIERSIFKALRAGDTTFFKRTEIKNADGYKLGPDRSPYFHYLLWEEVFASKYGSAPPPPYSAIKVNLNIKSKTDFKAYIDSLDDPAIGVRLVEFLNKYGKTMPSAINIPMEIVTSSGIPDEIIAGISMRKIVSNLVEPLMVLLESCSYFIIDGSQLRLVSDYY